MKNRDLKHFSLEKILPINKATSLNKKSLLYVKKELNYGES